VFKEGIARFLKLDSLMEHLTGYVESRIEILKFDLKEDLSKVASRASVLIFVALAGLFFLLFFSMGVAVALGQQTGYFWGFSIVAGFYVVVGVILFITRESLGKNIEKKIRKVIKQKQ
jgi:hypothetical protein